MSFVVSPEKQVCTIKFSLTLVFLCSSYASNPKQPSCKKKCATPKNAVVKKDKKSKVAAKKWL